MEPATDAAALDDVELWLLSIFSDRIFATSLTSCAKLFADASVPDSRAPVKRFSAPVSLPSASLNSLIPLSNCFHAISEAVRLSQRLFTLWSRIWRMIKNMQEKRFIWLKSKFCGKWCNLFNKKKPNKNDWLVWAFELERYNDSCQTRTDVIKSSTEKKKKKTFQII